MDCLIPPMLHSNVSPSMIRRTVQVGGKSLSWPIRPVNGVPVSARTAIANLTMVFPLEYLNEVWEGVVRQHKRIANTLPRRNSQKTLTNRIDVRTLPVGETAGKSVF